MKKIENFTFVKRKKERKTERKKERNEEERKRVWINMSGWNR